MDLFGAPIFAVYMGLAVHAESLDQPEVSGMDNPLGVVQIELELGKRTKAYCRHESSIIRYEDGYGLNECGVLGRLW